MGIKNSVLTIDDDELPACELDELDGGDALAVRDPRKASAREVLARETLRAALKASRRPRLLARPGLAVILIAPSAAWVAPLAEAARAIARGAYFVTRDGRSRQHRPDTDSDLAAEVLASGRSVVGVSPDPEAYLPRTLVGAADAIVSVPPPSRAVLRRAIRLVTGGRAPRIEAPPALDFPDLVAAIRAGSTPTACARRLAAAMQARAGVPQSASAPRLSELTGYGPAREWGLQLARDLRAWREGLLDWSEIQRAAVLDGPPGTGKTTFAGALARELGLPLVATSMGSLMTSGSGYLDAVCRAWSETIARAASQAPAVLFVDEIDAIPNRARLDGRSAEYWNALVGHILTTLDGVAAREAARLILLGATNRAEALDPALVRPGRFDRIIPIPPPDAAALAEIIRHHLGSDLAGEDLGPIAQLGEGGTGADARDWVKSARAAARAAGRALTVEDLVNVVAPPDPRPAAVVERIAVHEAGHALAIARLGTGELGHVTTVAAGSSGGRTSARRPAFVPTREALEREIVVALAGRAAEELVFGEVSAGSGGDVGSDLWRATRIAADIRLRHGLSGSLLFRAQHDTEALVGADPELRAEVEADLARLYGRALELIRLERRGLEALAAALVRRRHLDGEEALRLLESARMAPEGGRRRRRTSPPAPSAS
jgi:cell division protease FtsH